MLPDLISIAIVFFTTKTVSDMKCFERWILSSRKGQRKQQYFYTSQYLWDSRNDTIKANAMRKQMQTQNQCSPLAQPLRSKRMKNEERKIEIEICFDHWNRNREQIDIFRSSLNIVFPANRAWKLQPSVLYILYFVRNGSSDGICFFVFLCGFLPSVLRLNALCPLNVWFVFVNIFPNGRANVATGKIKWNSLFLPYTKAYIIMIIWILNKRSSVILFCLLKCKHSSTIFVCLFVCSFFRLFAMKIIKSEQANSSRKYAISNIFLLIIFFWCLQFGTRSADFQKKKSVQIELPAVQKKSWFFIWWSLHSEFMRRKMALHMWFMVYW